MKHQAWLVFFLVGTGSLMAQVSFDAVTVDVGNIGVRLSNVGTIGRPDVRNTPTGEPSMEYPLNTGIEHLFEAGFWIGAQVDGQTLVSTSAKDAASGYSTGGSGFEFTTETGNTIAQRSSLTNSDYFSFEAVSHQDLLLHCSDEHVIIPGTTTTINEHTLPLYADVDLESYAWNYSFADYFVILNYRVTNNSDNTWDSVWTGIWSDMVVRNVNVSTDFGSAFFSHGGYGFEDSLLANYAFDVDGDPGFTNSYGSIQFLGIEWREQFLHPNNAAQVIANGYPEPQVHSNFWIFNSTSTPPYNAPSNDVERYEKMKESLDYNDAELVTFLQDPNTTGGLTNLLSAGPITEVAPGESFTMVYALVAAKQVETGGTTGPEKDTPAARAILNDHLGWAKRTYLGEDLNENGLLDDGEDLDDDAQLDRFILPEPPATPNMLVISGDKTIDIYWDDLAESSIDPISKEMDFEGYRLYRTQIGDDFNLDMLGDANQIAQWDLPGNHIGYNNGLTGIALTEPIEIEGDTFHYHYQLDQVLNGWQYLVVLTAFDRGDETLQIESLESSFVENAVRVWPGTEANRDEMPKTVGVYPNPYPLRAAWDGSTSTTRKIIFYNLPLNARISIFTAGGDLVAELTHNSAYNGSDAGWFDAYGGDPDQRVFSGGEHAWDMLSESGQSITSGIYLFTVEDLDNNLIQEGKLVIID
jgi:hypothetical protein